MKICKEQWDPRKKGWEATAAFKCNKTDGSPIPDMSIKIFKIPCNAGSPQKEISTSLSPPTSFSIVHLQIMKLIPEG